MLLSLLDRLFGGKISTVALASAAVAYEQGDRARGARLVELAASAAPRDVGVQGVAATEAAKAGDHALALKFWDRALEIEPRRNDFALHAARAQRALGDGNEAARRCRQALANANGGEVDSALLDLLAQLSFAGPSYLEILKLVHALVQPRTYVEIGVANGRSIALADPRTRAIGVDPLPEIAAALGANTTVFRETSDDFFARHDARTLLGGLPVDLAFIDGMHLFEFALRDFINLERSCAAGSTILLDDCWPVASLAAARERRTIFWNGDVWRVLPALRKYRPGLRIATIATFPAGLCVVRGLDPDSRVLPDHYDEIVREFGALEFAAFEANREAWLEPCPNARDSIGRILA